MTPEKIIELIAAYNHMVALEKAGVAPVGFARNWADVTLDAESHDVVIAYIRRSQELVQLMQTRISQAFQGGAQ